MIKGLVKEVTEKDVALWLYNEVINTPFLYRDNAAKHIRALFGDDFIYTTKSGKLGISLKVMNEFRKINQRGIKWDRRKHGWKIS